MSLRIPGELFLLVLYRIVQGMRQSGKALPALMIWTPVVTENPIRGNDRVADPNRVTIPPHVRGGDIGAVGFPNAVQVASPSGGRSSRASTSGEHPQPDRAEANTVH